MHSNIKAKLAAHFSNPKYILFLISLVLLIIVPPLYSVSDSATILFDLIYLIVLFLGSLYTSNSVRNLLILISLAIMTYITHLFLEATSQIKFVNAIFTISFFFIVFTNLIKFVLKEKFIDANGIYAAISGYLVLGVMAAPLFYMIERHFPGAFTIHANYVIYDFIYYSFITLTTVGLGDIVPIHPFAKAVTIVVSIGGQLYLTILIAIIIGKYMFNFSRKNLE